MNIARYYLTKKNFIGAINRFKVVVTQYQTTRHVEEALMRLTESYMALGIRQQARERRRRARAQFPRQPLVQGRLQPRPRRRHGAGRGQGLLDEQGVQEDRAGVRGSSVKPPIDRPLLTRGVALTGTRLRDCWAVVKNFTGRRCLALVPSAGLGLLPRSRSTFGRT
jgi:hypothetical protein